MQWSHIQIKIKLFKPPWEEDLDKFFFPSKAICTSLKIEKHRSLEEGVTSCFRVCIRMNKERLAFSTNFVFFFPALPFFLFFFLCLTSNYGISDKTVIISYWPLRIRSQICPHSCLPPHYHLSPRSSPLLSEPQHIFPLQFLLCAKLCSTSQLFPLLQLISYVFSRLFPTRSSELSLNVTLLEKHLSSIYWYDGWVDGWGGLSWPCNLNESIAWHSFP